MRKYLTDARAAGMKPILVTPLTRRQFKEDVLIESSLAGHAPIVREITQQMNVPLIDLHDQSLKVCNALGINVCITLMSQIKDYGAFDGTQLTYAGSMIMGR